MLDVCLLGTGGMMPLPYRWLTSLLVRYNGSSLLIDCGEGTQIAIKEKGWSFKPIDVICFTHYHGDHISGLPGLLLTMGNADRTEPLTLIGPKGLERVVNSLRVIAPELPFQIKYIEITQPEQIFEMNGYRLKAFRVNHNVTCYGYTMEINRAGKFDVDRANEAAIPQKFWGSLQKGSDLFICEGMYGEKDKLKKAKEYKHMTFYEAAQLAKEAEVAEMWLTHYSPSLTHPEEYMDEVKKIFPNSIAAKDKRTVELTFSD